MELKLIRFMRSLSSFENHYYSAAAEMLDCLGISYLRILFDNIE